jgi:glycosyltransferase involved in cell wall biosynthesis
MLQYLSSSLPVVSTPLPDVINHFPATTSGVVYSSSDEMSDFVKTMETTILVDNLEELSKSARRFVSAHYSMEATTKHLVKILSDS